MFRIFLIISVLLGSVDAFSQFNPLKTKKEKNFVEVNKLRLVDWFNMRYEPLYINSSKVTNTLITCKSPDINIGVQFKSNTFIRDIDGVKYGIFLFKGFKNEYYTGVCDDEQASKCSIKKSFFDKDNNVLVVYENEEGQEIFNCKIENIN